MKCVVVTGVNGFVGKHLVNELFKKGVEVVGIGRELETHPAVADMLTTYFACDLTDARSVWNLPLESFGAIINLAGLAQVGASFDDPELYKRVNVGVLSVLGEELLKANLSPRIIAISTGAVYDSSQSMPLTETSKLRQNGSPYAMSKISMEQAATGLRERGLDCIVARPLNHIGPGQEPGFLVPDLFAKISSAQKTGQPIKVGNLSTKRDYTDVRDVVRAYALLAQTKTLHHNTYNVCTGKSISGSDVLKALFEASGNNGALKVEEDPDLIRPNDPADLFGSYERLTKDTGWQPEIPFGKTIQDFVSSKN